MCAEGISGTKCTQCEGVGHFIIENGTCNGMCLPLYSTIPVHHWL